MVADRLAGWRVDGIEPGKARRNTRSIVEGGIAKANAMRCGPHRRERRSSPCITVNCEALPLGSELYTPNRSREALSNRQPLEERQLDDARRRPLGRPLRRAHRSESPRAAAIGDRVCFRTLVLDQAQPRIANSGHYYVKAVRRPVVDDDHLERNPSLTESATEGEGKPTAAIPGGDDHGRDGPAHRVRPARLSLMLALTKNCSGGSGPGSHRPNR